MNNEAIVAKVSDLQDGGMKEVVVGETKVLLARINGVFYATAGECTHYGGPLAEGSLKGERVVCPWHQANFNVTTGAILEPPALDALPVFKVRVEGDDIIVGIPETGAASQPPPMCRCNRQADGRTLVIVGAGAAGNMAAQTLREDGYEGRLLMITQEKRLPYDRPNLSKGYLAGAAGPDSLPLRSEDFYRSHDIEVLLGKQVAEVDAAAKAVTFADGEVLSYHALLLATGGKARPLEVPGAGLANVFTLRSADDADAIVAAAGSDQRAVVVGASFIGMETAASLTKRGSRSPWWGRAPSPSPALWGLRSARCSSTSTRSRGWPSGWGKGSPVWQGTAGSSRWSWTAAPCWPPTWCWRAWGLGRLPGFSKACPSMPTAASPWTNTCGPGKTCMPPAISPVFPTGAQGKP